MHTADIIGSSSSSEGDYSPGGSFPERCLRVNGFPASLCCSWSEGEAEGAEWASRHLHQVSLGRLLGVETRQFDSKAGTSAETMCRRIAAPSAVHIRIQRFQ
jgi:hypothetical protein